MWRKAEATPLAAELQTTTTTTTTFTYIERLWCVSHLSLSYLHTHARACTHTHTNIYTPTTHPRTENAIITSVPNYSHYFTP